MKQYKFIKFLTSLALIAIVSTWVSYFFTGDPAKLFLPIAGVMLLAGLLKGFARIDGRIKDALLDGFVINDTTYAGEAASNFIIRAITENDTVKGGHVYVKDGIKKQFTIPRWDANYEDLIQDRAATPISKGTMVVDGQVLNPQDYMIYIEFNPRDYEQHWFATQLNPTLIDRYLPASVESVVIQGVLARHDKYMNKALWNNDSTLSYPSIYRYYNGFLKKAKLSASTIVVASPTTLTVTNIQGELLKGYSAIPAELRYNTDMKIFCSYNTYDLYAQSQINQTYKGVDITTDGIPRFKGRELVKIADFPDNTYFIARGMSTPESNLWVGMNSTDDAKLELSRLQNNSELFFIKMLMKVDVQIGWNQETVYYGS